MGLTVVKLCSRLVLRLHSALTFLLDVSLCCIFDFEENATREEPLGTTQMPHTHMITSNAGTTLSHSDAKVGRRSSVFRNANSRPVLAFQNKSVNQNQSISGTLCKCLKSAESCFCARQARRRICAHCENMYTRFSLVVCLCARPRNFVWMIYMYNWKPVCNMSLACSE